MSYAQIHMNYYNYIYIYIIRIIRESTFLVSLLCSLSAFAQDQSDIQLANEYLIKGDKQKALAMYRDLAKKNANIPLIHNNYLNTLIDLAQYSEAQDYLRKNQKRDPESLLYKLDMGLVLVRSGEVQKGDKYIRDLITDYRGNLSRIKTISDYFMARSLYDYSILALLETRAALENPRMFCLELATLYRIKGEKEKMTEEYLSYATQSVGNTQYIKNVLQVLLTRQEELETLEGILYEKVQADPEQEVYSDLLIWVTLQQKNFYASFVQARAYDKRYRTNGERCMEVAQVALDNKDYVNASKIYKYVIDNFPRGENMQQAQLGYVRAREARVRETYPINKDSVDNLVVAYKNFIARNPQQPTALEASRNLAVIESDFQQRPDSAIARLQGLINNPFASVYLKSKAKLDLADIYIIKEEPWESALLYAQVEKTQKESSVGYEAKLKNARLSYFRGDFQLAQEHLDILKEATTREIANDAMELSMRIKENILLDSSGAALVEFAKTELLLKQNRVDEALRKLSEIEQGYVKKPGSDSLTSFTNYAIKDDCYWLEAKIYLQKNEFDKSLTLCKKILEEYPTDILADDAFFMVGEIYERHLKDKAKAMEQYQQLLVQYPGSVYAAEARKRFRMLRGDFDEAKIN
jgi:outer membrane protein assembly factor BamD (BamD/ComL family)